jgi:hypothetical protein
VSGRRQCGRGNPTSHIITTFASLVTHDNATNKLTSIRRIVGGGAVIDATAEPVRGIGPGGRKPD